MNFVLLNNKNDFHWYKQKLDLDAKYEHDHVYEPKTYPCRVYSRFYDDPNGPYTYYHTFVYQKIQKCDKCGHETLVFPDAVDSE